MTRECNSDFAELEMYVRDYKVSNNLENDAYVKSMKSMHKCYFSVVTWNAEMEHNKAKFLEMYSDCNDEIVCRISEYVSDMGASLFNWINGSYKTARIMMRVGIENYIRAIGAIEDKDILIEKNVYKLFERANVLRIFNDNENVRQLYDLLHNDYKLLCEDAHTAAEQNMEHLSSLAGLPVYKSKKAEDTKKVYVRIARAVAGMYCIQFNSFFHIMYHRNKDNILNCMNRELKSIISGGKE